MSTTLSNRKSKLLKLALTKITPLFFFTALSSPDYQLKTQKTNSPLKKQKKNFHAMRTKMLFDDVVIRKLGY